MASTTLRETIKVGSAAVTGEFLRSVDEEIRELPGSNHPLVEYFGYGPAVTLDSDWKHEWMRNQRMDPTFLLTGTMTNVATTLTADGTHLSAADAALLQVGSVFIVLPQAGSGQTEELILVTAISGTSITVTRDYGNKNSGNGTAHASGDRCYILLSANLDTGEFQESPRRKGELVSNYAIQSMYLWTMTDYATSQVSYLQNKQDQFARDVTEGRLYALKQLNNQIIYGTKRQMSASVRGNFDGLRDMITTNVRTVTGNLTPTDIEEVLDDIVANDQSISRFTMLGTPTSRRILSGVLRSYFSMQLAPDAKTAPLNQLTAMQTDLGLVEFMEVRQMPEGELLILSDKNDFKLHPVQVAGMGTGWVDIELDARFYNARKRGAALSWIGTSKLGHEKKHGKIKGFTQTISSYGANAV